MTIAQPICAWPLAAGLDLLSMRFRWVTAAGGRDLAGRPHRCNHEGGARRDDRRCGPREALVAQHVVPAVLRGRRDCAGLSQKVAAELAKQAATNQPVCRPTTQTTNPPTTHPTHLLGKLASTN